MSQTAIKKPNFKELLDQEYSWPCVYTFKFIVPQGQKEKVESLFPNYEINFRNSTKGKYVSLTIQLEASSSDLIIAIYEKAATIEGLIAL